MNEDRLHQPSPYWIDHAKHHLYCDVAADSWSHMEPYSDWSLPHHRWPETGQSDDYHTHNSRYRDDISEHSSQQYTAPPMEHYQYHPQLRHVRPIIHSQHSVPSFMEYQGRVPPAQSTGLRCTSQPGFYNRSRDEQAAQIRRTESSSPTQRRCSESGFPSDMDLALFVEATSGFTPDSPVHRTYLDAPVPRDQAHSRPEYSRSHTSYAQSALVQRSAPSHSSPILPIRQPQPQSPHFVRQRPEVWQERLEAEPYAWQAHDYNDEMPPADELPDYEQSQAEMQNRNRLEAKRRAEELQRRWRQRHSR